MKIGVLSDTHGSYQKSKRALEALGPCDHIIHLGDVLYHGPRNPIHASYQPAQLARYLEGKKIHFIRGNCDSDVDCMVTQQDIYHKEAFFHWGELKIYAVHGYEESLEERIQKAKEKGANTLLFGHSHKKLLEKRQGLTIVNPGSTTLPKDGSPSCALYQDGVWTFIELKETELG